MKLRVTILLLAGVLLLLCAASQPQPNAENPKDARKIRYSQRQKLTNEQKAAVTDTSDPTMPLSLLPAGEDVDPQAQDAPNKAPAPVELKGGKTASASLDVAPTETGAEASSVRSLAIDGAPYGEVRKVVQKQPALVNKTPLVVATNTAQAKANARVPAISDGTKQAKATPAMKAAQPTKLPTTKPADQKLLASNAKPASKAATVPQLTPVPKAKTATAQSKALATPKVSVPTKAVDDVVANDNADEAVPSTEDRFKWLDEHLSKDYAATEHSADELRADGTPVATDAAPLNADEGELLSPSDKVALDESQLDPLGIPGQTVAAAPSRLKNWLFTLCGLFALGALIVAVPKPRRSSKTEDGLTLIESIDLAEGRELVILRKKHYALVLGVTRSATHLLEKVSMASLDSDYSSVINAIIKRESESPELWRMRPLFSGSYRTDYAPEERAAPARVTSLSELRASLHVVGPARVASVPPAVRQSMGELRDRSDVPAATVTRRAVSTGSSSREAVIRQIREQARRAS